MDELRRMTKAVVLAAGRGKRLGALTADQPKPMIPVAGVPVLERILRGIAAAGVTDFLLVVGYRAEAIEGYFGDGARLGLRIAYARQERANGTGAALALARDWASGAPVLASYGDILTDPAHYRGLLADYAGCECAAVIGINPLADPTAGAAVYRDDPDPARITRVVEKPPPGTAHSRWNLAGVSVYGAAIWPALADLKPSPRGEVELTDAIETLITSGRPVRAYEIRGFWSDIGTPEALAEAERELAQ